MPVYYLWVFGLEVHGRGDVEDAGASLDRVVEAAFLGQVGLPDGQPLRCSGKVQQWLRLPNVRWREEEEDEGMKPV